MQKALKVTSENLYLVAQTIAHWTNANLIMSDLTDTVRWNTEDGEDTYAVAKDMLGHEGNVVLMPIYGRGEFFQRYPNAHHIDTTEFKDI